MQYYKYCKKNITMYNKEELGFVAQLVEQLTLNQLVEGSSPSGPSSFCYSACKMGARTSRLCLDSGSSANELSAEELSLKQVLLVKRKSEDPLITSEQDCPSRPSLIYKRVSALFIFEVLFLYQKL